MPEKLDGLISFFASHHAIRAETVLKRGGFTVQLVPGPKELSPNCGVALRFEFDRQEGVLEILAEKRVRIDSVHHYLPRTDAWDHPRPTRKPGLSWRVSGTSPIPKEPSWLKGSL